METENIQLNTAPEKPKKKIWKGILNFLIYVAIIVVVIFGLPKVLSRYLNNQYPMAAITSGSMWPALKTDDLVFIKGVSPGEIKIGDIIVYKNKINNTFTIHRVVKIENGKITTKGDANFGEDEPVLFESVVGRTVFLWGKPVRIPYLGAVTIFASKYIKNGNASN